MSQIEPQNSEITRLSEEIFFLKEQIRNKDKVIDSLLSQLSKRDDVILQNRWPAIKRKIVSAKTVIVERRAATTMTGDPHQPQQQQQQADKCRRKTKRQMKIF